MNILFLNPPFHNKFSREQRSPAVTKSETVYYPKWLAHAAGLAIKNNHTVDLIDAPAESRSIEYVIDRIRKKSIDYIVCDTSTPSINHDILVVEFIKNVFPKISIMLVGRHVSALPYEVMQMSKAVDAIAIREYEFTVLEWVEAKHNNSGFDLVDGLVWKNSNGEIIKNKDRHPLDDLDQLPFVSEVYKKYLDVKNYFYGHSLYPLIVFDTSRGCPYHCSFCVYPQTFSGHRMRFRSVENVADEFDYVKKEFPNVKTVMLEDDTFIVNKKRTYQLADELIKRNNQILFDSNCRADIGIEEELLSKLKKAGARLFCVGFESGDSDVITHMKKNNNSKNDIEYINNSFKFVELCKKVGIMVHGCFMIGNLNETKESLNATLEFAKKLNPDTAQFFPIMVYPGTSAYDEAKQNGQLTTEDYNKWLTVKGLHNSVVNLKNLTHKDLVDFADKARREFYLRPSYLKDKLIQSVKNKDELKRNWKGFKSLSKYLINGSFLKEEK